MGFASEKRWGKRIGRQSDRFKQKANPISLLPFETNVVGKHWETIYNFNSEKRDNKSQIV